MPSRFMLKLLGEAVVSLAGVLLQAKIPFLRSFPHLGRLIPRSRLGRVPFPGGMVMSDVMASVMPMMCLSLRELLSSPAWPAHHWRLDRLLPSC